MQTPEASTPASQRRLSEHIYALPPPEVVLQATGNENEPRAALRQCRSTPLAIELAMRDRPPEGQSIRIDFGPSQRVFWKQIYLTQFALLLIMNFGLPQLFLLWLVQALQLQINFFQPFLAWSYTLNLLGPLCILIGSLAEAATRMTKSESRLHISSEGIFEEYGLSRTAIAWNDVHEVSVFRSSTFVGFLRRIDMPGRLGRSDNKYEMIICGSKSIRFPLNLMAPHQRMLLFSLLRNNLPDIEIPNEPQIARISAAKQKHPRLSLTHLWQSSMQVFQRSNVNYLASETTLGAGRYRVSEKLKTGGQANIYVAEMLEASGTKTTVVLKEFILPAADEDIIEQARVTFDRECAILKKIGKGISTGVRKWSIVRYIDAFEEDLRCYIVLEYVAGPTLQSMIEDAGPMDTLKVLDLSVQLADILSYLHSLRPYIVHQDFTPDNLIIDAEGKLKLVDFSAAKTGDESAHEEIAGKIGYMPPEQFRGYPVPQSDIYALGASMYFLITGRQPRSMRALRPSDIVPAVNPTLDAIVEKATQPEVKDRYQDAFELLSDLLILQTELQQSGS